MSLDSKHPLYALNDQDWVLCRDSYEGERAIKEKGTAYLPATGGQEADGMSSPTGVGYKSYQAYQARAIFHEFMKEAVETFLGIMWAKPPVITLPKKLEPMLTNATTKGESLVQLLRRINEEQLITGRLGLLLDLPTTPQAVGFTPYIAMYKAESIINWDDGLREEVTQDNLNLVILDESEFERKDDFDWQYENKYRVLTLGETGENEESGVYKVGVFKGKQATFTEESMETPIVTGSPLESIPFAFINAKDIVAEPDKPPLLGVAKLSLAIYRGEADYRQSLHMQGQDTLVIVGSNGDEEYRVGAGSAITLPLTGDAKFIGVSSSGLSEQRECLENDKALVGNKAGKLIDTRSAQKESGEALTKRVAAQTATLNQMALAGAGGLEKLLKQAAEWVGANPDEVSVVPNLDFSSQDMPASELVDLMSAKTMGAPISQLSIHNRMKNKGLTDMEYEEELAAIEAEPPMEIAGTGVDDTEEGK